ncbi:hypothetical protein [Paraburkholderia heleia]|uniref:hypothetical protein n=1 Tax=Paraburkholderia heleia TaxID=634127 RepID=UPI000B09A5E5|nr:hypothetical protein [Paraburkholderia heleia]
MDALQWGTAIGLMVLVVAATAVIAHYRRERRRANLLRNLHHNGIRSSHLR